MVNSLPAVLIGGPPHAGKSVLTYSLTQALRQRGVSHYVLRACPDGEGDWSQESDQDTVRVIRIKGEWLPEFVQKISQDLERRHLPLLVDMGGRPASWQMSIMRHCTHSILLLRTDENTLAEHWLKLVEEHSLLPVARLTSVLEAPSTLISCTPVVTGTLSGLQRGTTAQGPVFERLVERIETLFTSYPPDELLQGHLDAAPAELVDLNIVLQRCRSDQQRWEPSQLERLLSEMPVQTPLAVYGRGTNWLYGALAAHVGELPFYQFDPRLGWIAPPTLKIGTPPSEQTVQCSVQESREWTRLNLRLITSHLDYLDAERLVLPAISSEKGLILDGKLPVWLVSALVRMYSRRDVPWIACYYPQLAAAVIVMTRTAHWRCGQLVPVSPYMNQQ